MSVRHEFLDTHLPLHDKMVASLPPHIDMTPQLVYTAADGTQHIAVIPGYDDTTRDEFLAVIVEELREERASVALISRYGWRLSGEAARKAIHGGVRPRDHAQREEVCVVYAVDKEGATAAIAPVVRSDSVQMLGEWERRDAEDAVEIVSAEVGALTQGVKS